MIFIARTRKIIYSSTILPFILFLFLVTPIIIKIGVFFGSSDIYILGSSKGNEWRGFRFGIAEAAEVTYKFLWHSIGMPDDIPLNKPQGFCLDPDFSQIYVADTENDRVMIFSSEGHPIGQFLTSHPLNRPFDLVIGPNGMIYISQIEKKTIDVFNKKGLWQTSIPKDPNGNEFEFTPGRMAFDLQGRLLVIDRNGSKVWAMTVEGKLLKKIYEAPKEKKFTLLTGLTVSSRGKIFVASAQGLPVVMVMNPEGAHLFSFGRHGALYDDSFSFPNSLAVDDKGKIWIVDAFRHTVKVFAPEGNYLFSIGELGEEPGSLMFPVDIHIDREGVVYVLEKGAGRLQAFSVEVKKAE